MLDENDPRGSHTQLPCGHWFHSDCALAWARRGNAACAVCRHVPEGVAPPADDDAYIPTVRLARHRVGLVRRFARNKSAPREVKRLLETERKARLMLRKARAELGAYRKLDLTRAIIKEVTKLETRVWQAETRLHDSSVRLGLYVHERVPFALIG